MKRKEINGRLCSCQDNNKTKTRERQTGQGEKKDNAYESRESAAAGVARTLVRGIADNTNGNGDEGSDESSEREEEEMLQLGLLSSLLI